MILRWTTLLWLVAFAVAVGLVFQIKYEVQELEGKLARTQAEIQRDREAIHVLRADWSYLNRPQRIARLAEKHLEMMPLTAPQIGRIGALPPRPENMDGRVFAATPLPPRRPAADLGDWHGRLPQPGARPDGRTDPIGDLVAATIAEAPPAPRAAPAVRPVPEPQPRTVEELQDGTPRNPVTGAPLPVSATTARESQ
jgi:cell division protein FtsL